MGSEKTPMWSPQRPPRMPSTHTAQHDDPIPPTTVGARVLDRDRTVFGGYHPSKRPVGTTCDGAQIGTKTPLTSPEWISGFRDARRGPQDRARPAGWQSCLGRLPKLPENAQIAFRWGWHKSEMLQPLKRPAQTRQAPPAPASSLEE